MGEKIQRLQAYIVYTSIENFMASATTSQHYLRTPNFNPAHHGKGSPKSNGDRRLTPAALGATTAYNASTVFDTSFLDVSIDANGQYIAAISIDNIYISKNYGQSYSVPTKLATNFQATAGSIAIVSASPRPINTWCLHHHGVCLYLLITGQHFRMRMF